MSHVVEWNGRKYDIDPTELTQMELKEIKKRTGLTFKGLVEGIGDLDPDTLLALFWVIDWRADQNVKFSDYEGPTLREVLPHVNELIDVINTAMPSVGKETSGTDGSPSSPSGSDTPPTSSTD